MRVFLNKQTNIIDIPENNAATLVDITSEGYFVYDITYQVDPKAALQNNAIVVKILASTKTFSRQSPKMFPSGNPDQIIKNILTKNSVTKDLGRSQQGNVFFSYNSDISSRIPNDKTRFLRPNVSSLLPAMTLTTEKVLKLKQAGDITDDNIIMPVLENNIASSVLGSELTRTTSVARAVSTDLVFRKGIDPAQLSGMRTNTIQSAKKVSGGIVSKPNSQLGQAFLSEKQRVSLIGGLVNEVNPSNHTQVAIKDFVNVMVNQPKTIITITETLEIPVGLIDFDEFYFVLQLTDNTGVVVQEINLSVPHAKNIANLKIPSVPPLLEILQTGLPGKNIVNVKQMDDTATGISVYRKENKPDVPVTDAGYVFVGKIDTTKGQDFQRLEDFVNNYNPITYRAIAYNENNTLSSEFTSRGTSAIKMSKRRQNLRRNFVSLAAEVVSGGISLDIRDIPPGVFYVTLFKRDKSFFSKTRTLVGSPVVVNNQESQSPVFIMDADVKLGRIYEYECELLYPDGQKNIASTKITVQYEPVTANVVSTTTTPPEIIQTGSGFDAVFTIRSSLVATNLDKIKKTLENQGLLSYYQDSLTEEKEKFQNIIAYTIRRTNLTTGDVEDFGTITETSFSDRQFGSIAGALPLQAGCEYRYSIHTHFRRADTALNEATKTVQVNQNVSYTFKPARWLHPVTLSRGTMVTERSLARNHAQSVFSFGVVGDIITTNVSLANILPSISEARCQKLGKNATLIQWRVQGTVTKIDHFIITLESVGMKTIVGKSHNISESNYFQFVDKLEDGEHGKLKYTIVPVYYDFSRGTEMITNEVIV